MQRPELWDDHRTRPDSAAGGRTAPAPARPRTVVLGYDGSAAARTAAFRAAEAAGRGGRVLIITAVPSPDTSEFEWESAGDPQQLLREATALLRNHRVEIATRLEEGHPADALVAAACGAGADLIVVGARGRSFLARALRGSVAERLITRASCSVLVAR